jgi:hypothetical protein
MPGNCPDRRTDKHVALIYKIEIWTMFFFTSAILPNFKFQKINILEVFNY